VRFPAPRCFLAGLNAPTCPVPFMGFTPCFSTRRSFRQPLVIPPPYFSNVGKYYFGFHTCLHEVHKYLFVVVANGTKKNIRAYLKNEKMTCTL